MTHVSPHWRAALLGAIASLPVTGVLNWLPNAEATVGGSVMIFGAFVAGAIAARRSIDPGAVGLRTGFLGGIVAIGVFLGTSGIAATWSPARTAFFVVAGGVVLCVAPIFGLGCGRVGGWVASLGTSYRTA
jgi:hypothetical protein